MTEGPDQPSARRWRAGRLVLVMLSLLLWALVGGVVWLVAT